MVLADDFCVSLLCDLGLTSGCLLFVVYFVGVEVLCFSSSCLLVLLVSGYWIPGGVWFYAVDCLFNSVDMTFFDLCCVILRWCSYSLFGCCVGLLLITVLVWTSFVCIMVLSVVVFWLCWLVLLYFCFCVWWLLLLALLVGALFTLLSLLLLHLIVLVVIAFHIVCLVLVLVSCAICYAFCLLVCCYWILFTGGLGWLVWVVVFDYVCCVMIVGLECLVCVGG